MTTCARCGAVLAGDAAACPRCLMEAELPPAMLGESIELHEEIGSGGMGLVFRARHRGLDREVAVKVLPTELSREPGFAERFEREGRAMARLSHPRIVGVHDAGRSGDVSYIVMELVRGGSLASAVPLPVGRAVAIALEVCEALEYAHAEGVVHRDVKPDNVLLDEKGHVKLGDFGIAALGGHRASRATLPGVALGTPGYMAPESLAGAPPDPRMDVYSVGALLHEMILGHPPRGEVGPLPASVAPAVRRALDPDPGRRPSTIAELRHAILDGAREGLPLDERAWVRAVALVETVASAVVLYALLASVTPRILAPGDVPPLTVTSLEPLPDGRLVSWARFETGAILGALAAVAAGIVAYGTLVRHWRRSDLLAHEPARPIPEARLVLLLGAVAAAVATGRHVLLARGITSPYAPILGGLLETACLYALWLAILEARRTARPLTREPMLHAGALLFLLPPVYELWSFLERWKP